MSDRSRRSFAYCLFAVVGAAVLSCARPEPRHEYGLGGLASPRVEGACDKVAGTYAVRRPGDNVRPVGTDDPEMLGARAQARRTLGYFLAALENPTPGMREFKVKGRFAEGQTAEHMWVAKVRFDGTAFSGELDNDPEDLRAIEAGDRVTIFGDRVEDWLFVDGDQLMGAYTLRYFLRRMTEQSCRRTLAAFQVERLGAWDPGR